MVTKPSLFHTLVASGIQTGHQSGNAFTGDIIVDASSQARDIVRDYDVPHVIERGILEVPFHYNKKGAEEQFLSRLQVMEYGLADNRPSGDFNIVDLIQKKMGTKINGFAFDALAEAAISNDGNIEDVAKAGAIRDLLSTAIALSYLENDTFKSSVILNGIKNDERLPEATRSVASQALALHQIIGLSMDMETMKNTILPESDTQALKKTTGKSISPGL